MEFNLTMRKLLLALLLMWPTGAWAQCTGVFPANTLCGNLTGTPQPPAAFSSAGTIAGPSLSTSGDIPAWSNNLGTQLSDPATISTSQSFGLTGTTSLATTFITSLNVTSTFSFNGATITFPVSGTVGLLGTNQTWTGTNSFNNLAANTTSLSISGNGPITIPLSVSFGGVGSASITSHSVLIGEGTNPVSNSTAGVTGQCIVSNGVTADPTFTSGCRVLLSTTTATSGNASISDTTHITAAYNDYDLVIENCLPVSSGVTLVLQDTLSGGVATSNYVATVAGISGGAISSTTSTANLPLNISTLNNLNPGYNGTFRLYTADPSGHRRWVGQGGSTITAGPAESPHWISGYLNVAQTVTGWQIQFFPGNIASCTVKFYGLL